MMQIAILQSIPAVSRSLNWASTRVVSLLEMLEFHAEFFVKTLADLNAFEIKLQQELDGDAFVNPHILAALSVRLEAMMKESRRHGFDSIADQCERLLGKIERAVRSGEIREGLNNLRTRFEDDFGRHMFFHLTASEAAEYRKPLEGWEDICERFGGAIRDVEEMNKCFALERYPASVFHSMQVIEHGLIRLGEWLNVKDRKVGWNATTQELTRIARLEPKDRTDWENRHHGFIVQMEAVSHSLMTAWRHKIDHASGRLSLLPGDFAPEIARDIIGATRAFMLRLAIELPSDSRP